ncbi:unnamed protein product [Pleuronectes platessa]|uniref:Uncharacterized protein n=1 Tax=Pleuronectes platessa TaxID=8262 RepID=A0A9N7UKJ0_PLEPL|nr:unnamed protein product [Pleuronectes platessa]
MKCNVQLLLPELLQFARPAASQKPKYNRLQESFSSNSESPQVANSLWTTLLGSDKNNTITRRRGARPPETFYLNDVSAPPLPPESRSGEISERSLCTVRRLQNLPCTLAFLFNDSGGTINAAASVGDLALSSTEVPRNKLLIKIEPGGSLSLQGRPNRCHLQELRLLSSEEQLSTPGTSEGRIITRINTEMKLGAEMENKMRVKSYVKVNQSSHDVNTPENLSSYCSRALTPVKVTPEPRTSPPIPTIMSPKLAVNYGDPELFTSSMLDACLPEAS